MLSLRLPSVVAEGIWSKQELFSASHYLCCMFLNFNHFMYFDIIGDSDAVFEM